MADTNTPRLNLVKPEVGASDNSWGAKINENLDKLDAAIVKKTGDTMAGSFTMAQATPPNVPFGGTITATNFGAVGGYGTNCTVNTLGTGWQAIATGKCAMIAGDYNTGRLNFFFSDTTVAGANVVFNTMAYIDTSGTVYAVGPVYGASFKLNGSAAQFSRDATKVFLAWAGPHYLYFDLATGNLYHIVGEAVHSYYANTGTGSSLVVTANAFKPGGGPWADTSDARIKEVVGDYVPGLDEVAALAPKRFRYKGNDFEQNPADSIAGGKLPSRSAHAGPAEDGTVYTGLIAQEVELLFPDMVSRKNAWIDGEEVDDLRVLDTTPLIFAMVNAIKELKSRVEALEANNS